MSEYLKSLGFQPCEFGCGVWVHPNPSDPNAPLAVWNHVCIPRLMKWLEEIQKWAERESGR